MGLELVVFNKNAADVLTAEHALPPWADAVGLYFATVAPALNSGDVYVQKPGGLAGGEHGVHALVISHC